MNEYNGTQIESFVSLRHSEYPFISPDSVDLSGKAVFIAGASRGIGRVTAIRFAMSGCSHIAIAARTPLDEVHNMICTAAVSSGWPSPHVLSLNMDVTFPESVQAAAATVAETFGNKLDILVTNAGTMENWQPIAQADPEEWWATWEVNTKGTFLCAHYFIPLLLNSNTKISIMVSSGGAYKLGHGASGYNTSRLATCRLNEFVDHEYSSQGLISIAVHPGNVATDLSAKLPQFLHPKLVDTPELAADTMVWLSDQKPRWLSGRYISCNWDMEELKKKQQDIVGGDLFKFRMAV